MANKRLDYDKIYELVMECRKSGLYDRLELCQYLGHKKLNFFSLPNRQGDIVLSCKSLILNLLWCLVFKGTVTPFSVVK